MEGTCFTRASTHTVWSSRFRQAKADAGLVLLCPLASLPNCLNSFAAGKKLWLSLCSAGIVAGL